MDEIFGEQFGICSDPYQAFGHSLVTSKLWLCDKLEEVIHNKNLVNPIVHVLGSWHNVLTFMMIVRKPSLYSIFHCYDKDNEALHVGNRICDTWKFEYPKVLHHNQDVNSVDFNPAENSIFINCSVDQFDGTTWYDNIPNNSYVVLQSTDLPITHADWEIKQSYNLVSDLTDTYKVRQLFYADTKFYNYSGLRYKRHMMIGLK
jgi:hypothetical protein